MPFGVLHSKIIFPQKSIRDFNLLNPLSPPPNLKGIDGDREEEVRYHQIKQVSNSHR